MTRDPKLVGGAQAQKDDVVARWIFENVHTAFERSAMNASSRATRINTGGMSG